MGNNHKKIWYYVLKKKNKKTKKISVRKVQEKIIKSKRTIYYKSGHPRFGDDNCVNAILAPPPSLSRCCCRYEKTRTLESIKISVISVLISDQTSQCNHPVRVIQHTPTVHIISELSCRRIAATNAITTATVYKSGSEYRKVNPSSAQIHHFVLPRQEV